ncbi:MAG: hypothetical protein JXA46_11055 [Dehalococcoidales bacterium]|nr:hypothetical protein [Dehalococcoidales bacterium]
MRAPLNEKNNIAMKAPSKEKSGLLIRLPIKKIYCAKCQKLVRGKAQIPGNGAKIDCPRCGQNLWSWSRTSWRGAGNEAEK